MLMEGLNKLSALADKLDRLPPGGYNQRMWCSCALAHHYGTNGLDTPAPIIRHFSPFRGAKEMRNGIFGDAAAEFGITMEEAYTLFDGSGCNNAFMDAWQAAHFIREFVATKRATMKRPAEIIPFRNVVKQAQRVMEVMRFRRAA